MNRRAFLSLSAVSPLAHLLPAFADDKKPGPGEIWADVAVIGGGVGGVACALAAARNGLKVVMTEEFDWIGGQLTSQAVPPDEHPWIEERGATRTYREFRTKIRDHYRRNYPLTPAAKDAPTLNPGNGSVSKLCHEPRAAVAVLLEMLAPYITSGRIRLIQHAVPVKAATDGDTIRAVVVEHVKTRRQRALVAPYFVDATETGELLEVSGTEFVTGSEARRETKEPHAPVAARPANHQAFTYCFAVDHIEGEDHTIEEPADYDFWSNYVPKMTPGWAGHLLSWGMSDPITLKERRVGFAPIGPPPKGLNLWTYRRIADRANFTGNLYPSDVCLVNWPQNDYWLGNLYGDGPAAARQHAEDARELSLCLLYWMQTAAPRADGKKAGWKGLRLRPDVVGTDDGLAQAPYVRESRRIQSLFTVTENHVGTDAREKETGKKRGEFTAEKFADSVGVGSYRIDLHPSSGGENYIDVSSLPFQIPLGCLLPKRVENLLPACKNIGTTHITNGCYRLHPVEWNVGEAVGELVAFCVAKKRNPKQVRRDPKLLADFQAGLTKAGFELDWPEAIAKTPR